jgi:hypothetical protein
MHQAPNEQEKPGSARRKDRLSTFAVAFSAFVLTNIGLTLTQPFAFDKFANPLRTWTYWSINDIRTRSLRPDIALLGSSLMVTAMTEADASYTQQRLDLLDYRDARYLDKLLSTQFGGKCTTMNLAAPGQMPSDAYLTLKAALQSGAQPRMVIYGVAPRDFIDGTLQNAYDTEPFQYLKRVVNIDDIASDIYRSPLDRFDWSLHKSLFGYGNATDLKMSCHRLLDTALTGLLFKHETQGISASRLIPNYKFFEMQKGALMAEVPQKDPNAHLFIDNLSDYKARYRRPDMQIYKIQMSFVERLCELCNEHGTELVLVNMPITRRNVSLLPPSVHAKYLRDLAALASERNVAFIDQCRFENYQPQDYRDSVHLNGFGGKKFVDYLVRAIKADPAISRSLVAITRNSAQASLAAARANKPQAGLQ